MDTVELVQCLLAGLGPASLGKIKKVDVKTLRLYFCGECKRRVQLRGKIRGYQIEAQGLENFYSPGHWGRAWPMGTKARSFVCVGGRELVVIDNARSPSNLSSSSITGLELQQGSHLLCQTNFPDPPESRGQVKKFSPMKCDRKSCVWFLWC